MNHFSSPHTLWRRFTCGLSSLLSVGCLLGLAMQAAAQAPCPDLTNTVGPATGPLALCPGGSLTLTAQATMPAFQAFAGFDGQVYATLVQPDGKILVGGSFTTYNNLDVPDALIRLNADGSRDLSFIPTTFGGFRAFSFVTTPVNETAIVKALALQPDGKVLVAGYFSQGGSAQSGGLVRLNGTDGSTDLTFGQVGNAQGFKKTASLGSTVADITTLALQPDGKVLVSGIFDTYNGVARTKAILRLSSTGVPDASFIPVGYGPFGAVSALALQPDGKILVSGNSTQYQSTTIFRVPAGLMRLNADGTYDASFNTYSPVASAGFNNGGGPLVLQPDGKIIVADGHNLYTVTNTTYNGVAVPNIIRLNANGSYDATFNPGGRGVSLTPTMSNNDVGYVYALLLQADGKVVVGGSFDAYNNALAAPNSLLRLTPTGQLDVSYNAGGSGIAHTFANTTNVGSVQALALLPDGNVLAAGVFTGYNGLDAPDNILRLLPDGGSGLGAQPVAGASYTWSNGATGPSITVTQPGVYTATASSGTCTATSLGVQVLAAAATTVRVAPAGPLNLPAGSSATLTAAAVVPGFNVGRLAFDGNSSTLLSMVLQADGKLLVGGELGPYNGSTAGAQRLIRLLPDGTPDNTFNPGGTSFDHGVYCIAVQSDGKIIVGGNFSAYNGNAAAPDCLARLNADGTLDPSFTPNVVLGQVGNSNCVRTVCIQPDGKILVGGGGTPVGGALTNTLVRLNPDGSRDVDFNRGGSGYPYSVFKVLLQPDGRILVGGHYGAYNNYVNGNPAGVSRLYADGTIDQTFNYVFTGGGVTGGNGVYSLALQPDGKVVVGGYFTAYNNITIPAGLVRVNANGSLDPTFNPTGTGVNFNGNVQVLALQPDGKIVAGGDFTSFNGNAAAPDALLRFNTDGSLDNTFNSGGAGVSGSGRTVRGLAIQADGKVVAGGNFTAYNGTPAGSLFRVKANGSLDNADTPIAGATYSWSPGGSTGPTLAVTASGTYTATASVPGGCGGTSAPVTVTVTAAPAVASLAAPANGTYGPFAATGFRTLDIALTANQPLTVTGTPQLGLTIGSATRQANYVSGGGTATLVFRYPVAVGDLDTDGIALGSLSLNGGTIRNSAGTDAVLTLPAAPSLTGVLADGVAPTATGSTRLTPAATPTNATSVSYQVVFGEAVTGVDAADFTLSATGTAAGNVTTVSGSGTTYTVTATASGNGTLRLDLRASGTGILDAVNNPLGTGYAAGEVFGFDRVAPVTTRTGQPANPTVSTTATFSFAGTDATVGGISSGVARYEASLDGAAFVTVTSPATYTGLAPGSHTFTLRAVDNAGNVEAPGTTYSWLIQPLATAPALTAAAVALHPNPAGAGAPVTLLLPLTTGSATLEVLNALGQVVRPAQVLVATGGQATANVPTAGLAAGVYVLRLHTATASISKRLVVE